MHIVAADGRAELKPLSLFGHDDIDMRRYLPCLATCVGGSAGRSAGGRATGAAERVPGQSRPDAAMQHCSTRPPAARPVQLRESPT